MVVEITRCSCARVGDDGRIYAAIPLPEGKRALANIDATGVIAITCALPTNYATVALKGSDAARIEWPDMDRVNAEHRRRFLECLLHVGLHQATQLTLLSSESVAIAFTPTELFDQTPGPGAGLAIKT